MRIGIIVLCRNNSNRLPGKVLIQIGGRSVLGHIVDRLKRAAVSYPIIVATSDQSSDDSIELFCNHSLIPCYRGSLANVSDRFVSCAEKWGLDYAVRINGDNLFTDPDTIRPMLAIAETGAYDFITNVPGRTFPYGMSVEIVRTDFYRQTVAMQSLVEQEHVTTWLYYNESVGRRYHYYSKLRINACSMKLALDTQEDLKRFESIAMRSDRYLPTLSLQEVVRLARAESNSPWLGQHGPLLIAEIGGNHEGDFKVAKELTRKAISTGIDFVKFQLYRGNTLVSPYESPDRNAHFSRFELNREQHIELAEMCKESGIGYMASVWDLEMLDWVDDYMPIYKIGSGDLTAWPIIKEFAKRGKPIIISTGLATLDEVLQTVSQLQDVDKRYFDPDWLCLLQCTAMYPIDYGDANLHAMNTLGFATGLATGYSDHTEGVQALSVAAAMGAKVLEFHFTDTRDGKSFRDHKVSLNPEEIVELQKELDLIAELKGNGTKTPQQIEVESGHITTFRRGAYLPYPIDRGHLIDEKDLLLLRPNYGLDPRDITRAANIPCAQSASAYERIILDSNDQ